MNREQAEQRLYAIRRELPQRNCRPMDYKSTPVDDLLSLCEDAIQTLSSVSAPTTGSHSVDCCSCHVGMAPCPFCERQSMELEGGEV